jgi:hypothetical protein
VAGLRRVGGGLASGGGGVLGVGGVLWLALYGEREAAAERGRWGMWP